MRPRHLCLGRNNDKLLIVLPTPTGTDDPNYKVLPEHPFLRFYVFSWSQGLTIRVYVCVHACVVSVYTYESVYVCVSSVSCLYV